MKSFRVWLLMFLAFPAWAQETSPAPAAPAAKDPELRESFERLNTDVEGLMNANVALQKRLAGITEELRKLREEQLRMANNNSVQEDIKRLAEKIQEVDKKRADDRELILEQISKLGKLIAANAAPASSGSHGSPGRSQARETERSRNDNNGNETRPNSDVPEKGFEYVIKQGDVLANIVAEYNAEFKRRGLKTVTIRQVLDANPTVKDASRIRVGQKIFIPMPGDS